MFRASFRWPLFFALVLGAAPGHAQTRPSPPPPQKVLHVRVVLPTLLGKLAEVAGLLPDPSKTQTPTDNPVVTLAVPLPRFLSKSEPAPARPRKP